MKLQALFSRRSLVASVGALVARTVCPGSRKEKGERKKDKVARAGNAECGTRNAIVEAGASAASPLSAAGEKGGSSADVFGQITYFHYVQYGRLLSIVTPLREGECIVRTYYGCGM